MEVASDSCDLEFLLSGGAVVLLLEVLEGESGVFQSDPRGRVTALPLVSGSRRVDP